MNRIEEEKEREEGSIYGGAGREKGRSIGRGALKKEAGGPPSTDDNLM